MKKIILFLFFVFILLNSYSQLKVVSDGKVGIGTFLPKEQLQIGDSWTFTNYPTAKGINYNSYWNNNILRIVDSYCSTIRFNSDGSIQFDSAPYGTAGSIVSFNQNMKIYNNGYVTVGSIYPSYKLNVLGTVYAANFQTISDKRVKTDIKKLNNSLDLILQLNPVSFKYDKKFEIKNTSYGFLAQEVVDIIPDIVFSDSNQMMSIDYIAIIPFLVDAIKIQNGKIEELEKTIKNYNKNSEINFERSFLFQNQPNPFTSNTLISFIIDKDVQISNIEIFDIYGTLIETINIFERGKSSITINSNKLSPGIYIYSLVCDGKMIDSKKMLLTK